jgi:hypothetical protein
MKGKKKSVTGKKKLTNVQKKKLSTIQKKAQISEDGKNINYIHIDQSKRTTRRPTQQQQLRQSAPMNTITPIYMPSPPQPNIFNQPPAPTNPFNQVVQSTQPQKAEKNELEKPKKQTSDSSTQSENEHVYIPTVEALPVQAHPIFVESFPVKEHPRPIQFVESFPVKEETPIVKAIKIKPARSEMSIQTEPLQDAIIMKPKKMSTSGQQTEIRDMLNVSQQTERTNNPIMKSISTETDAPRELTPLEKPIQEMALIPVKKSKVRSNIHTFTELEEGSRVETKPAPQQIYFIGQGSRLSRDPVIERLTREELRQARIRALEKPQIQYGPEKPQINPPELKPEINQSIDVGFSPEEIEKLKRRTSQYRKAEESNVYVSPDDETPEEFYQRVNKNRAEKARKTVDEYLNAADEEEPEPPSAFDQYVEKLKGIKSDYGALQQEAIRQGISTHKSGKKKGAKSKTELFEELMNYGRTNI